MWAATSNSSLKTKATLKAVGSISVPIGDTDLPPERKSVDSDKNRSGGQVMERNDARRS